MSPAVLDPESAANALEPGELLGERVGRYDGVVLAALERFNNADGPAVGATDESRYEPNRRLKNPASGTKYLEPPTATISPPTVLNTMSVTMSSTP